MLSSIYALILLLTGHLKKKITLFNLFSASSLSVHVCKSSDKRQSGISTVDEVIINTENKKNVLPFAASPSPGFEIKCILNVLSLGHDLVVLLDVLRPTAAQST